MKTLNKLLLAFSVLAILTACGEDDEPAKPSAAGEVSFTVSGAVTGQKTGTAALLSSAGAGRDNIFFSLHDGVSGTQTYSLAIFESGGNMPTVGTYTIGSTTSDYWMIYTDTQTNTEFGSFNEDIGSITITEVTDALVKGTFSFDAPEFSDTGQHTGRSIVVNDGTFTASVQTSN
jgi:hypothetical protein